MKEQLLECMKKQLLECMKKLKEIQSLAVDQMKSIKKMQVLCKSLRLARYEQETPTKEGGGQCAPKKKNLALYEQEKLIKESDGQCKLKDKKSHRSSIKSNHSTFTQFKHATTFKSSLQHQKAYHLCGCSIIRSFQAQEVIQYMRSNLGRLSS